MKTNGWLILGMMLAASAPAQDSTNTLSPLPAPPAQTAPATAPAEPVAAPAPVKHKVKKHAVVPKAAALVEPTVALVPGPAEVTVTRLNVRGQAGLKGEVIGRLTHGNVVTVLSQLNLKNHAAGEPAQWAKIALPASIKTWVNTKFIDPTNNTVLASKLNLRSGPGENYSVLGRLDRGTAVNVVTTQGDWTQIDPPTNAVAFVAAIYLKQEASRTLVANPSPSAETELTPPPTNTTVAEAQPIVAEGANTNGTVLSGNAGGAAAAGTPAPGTAAVAAGNTGAPAAVPPPTVDTNLPPTPRIVTHEGVVGGSGSVITPTAYVLYDPATTKEINFLYTTSPNLDISRYYGMRIIVTGEESLAARWPDTPVLTIHRIQVLQTNATPKAYYPIPRQRH